MRFIRLIVVSLIAAVPCAAQTVTVLHNMTGADGSTLYRGLTAGSDGYLYGIASSGGANSMGSIFRISTSGMFTLLYSFSGADGAYPYGALTKAPSGTLYGTTNAGGKSNLGTVYSIRVENTESGPVGAVTTVHTFKPAEGSNPYGGVSFDTESNIYGTTTGGGAYGWGAVYKISSGVFTVLHSFQYGAEDGQLPYNRVTVLPDGSLAGITRRGGDAGYGSVYALQANGSFYGDESVTADEGQWLYSDLDPRGDGTYEGAALVGGNANAGAVFDVASDGTISTLYEFPQSVLSQPYSTGTVGSNGLEYFGVSYGSTGGIISIDSAGDQLVYTFNTSGAVPSGKLAVGPDGALYGTTLAGGTNGDGLIYKMTLD